MVARELFVRLISGRSFKRYIFLFVIWTLGCYFLLSPPSPLSLSSLLFPTSHNRLGSRGLLYRSSAHPSIPSTTPTPSHSTTEEVEPAIDRSPKLSEAALASRLQEKMPNLPIVYWQEHKNKNMAVNSTCAKFPSVFDLHFNNRYWQEVETSNGTFLLYGAYLDVRPTNRLGPTVRVLGMINRLEPKVKTFCQLWFSDSSSPIISHVLEYKYIWYKKWGNYKQGLYQPYLLACQLPKTHWGKTPESVSIVEKECDTATSNLRVIYNKVKEGEEKKKFAVCVKGLDFPEDDLSVRLVEWIELLTTLGANKVFFYELEVHPNVTKVLDHYSQEGKVEVTPLSLPGHQPNLPVLQHLYLKSKLNNKRQNELIPYNDCLYRNMYRYEYIALLDIDEVIMPLKHGNWADMMAEAVAESLKIKNETRASWNFRNVYFMDEMEKDVEKDIPSYLHMLQHVHRSVNYTKPGQYVKCFHNPSKVLILHNHFPLGCLGGVCTSYPVDTELAHLAHYRSDCVSTLKKVSKGAKVSSCEEFRASNVRDTSVWRWRTEVVDKTSPVLTKLGFLTSKHVVTDSPAIEEPRRR